MNIVELFRIGSKVSNLIEITVDYCQEEITYMQYPR